MASCRQAAQPDAAADKPLLAVLKGERRDPPPIWMMRQAGRYLPEYRALRADKGGFLDLVYDSDAAAEITLQPLKRFPRSMRAILFSDILIVPFAIGQNLTFVAGEGPRLTPPLSTATLDDLTAVPGAARADLRDGGQGQGAARPGTTLIGFAGARGPSPPTWSPAKAAASRPRRAAWPMLDPGRFGAIIDAHRGGHVRLSVAARSRPGPMRCNCSTAGRAAWRRPSSSAG